MNPITTQQFCEKTKPCKEAKEFVMAQPTMADAWANCSKVEWMLWATNALKIEIESKILRLFAVWCIRNTPLLDGRKTGDLLTDPRAITALEIAERYALGRATIQELKKGRDAAWDAAGVAAARVAAGASASARVAAGASASARVVARDAARDAAGDAAAAAARDATGDVAAAAARVAAWDAAWDAARDATGDAARAAAWAAAGAAQADQLRKIIPNPFTQKGAK